MAAIVQGGMTPVTTPSGKTYTSFRGGTFDPQMAQVTALRQYTPNYFTKKRMEAEVPATVQEAAPVTEAAPATDVELNPYTGLPATDGLYYEEPAPMGAPVYNENTETYVLPIAPYDTD